jgi:hypothetical protein
VEDEETTDVNGYNIHGITTEAQSSQILRDDLEDGELEDGELGGAEAAKREQVLEQSSSTPEKVSTCLHRQPDPLDWLIYSTATASCTS